MNYKETYTQANELINHFEANNIPYTAGWESNGGHLHVLTFKSTEDEKPVRRGFLVEISEEEREDMKWLNERNPEWAEHSTTSLLFQYLKEQAS